MCSAMVGVPNRLLLPSLPTHCFVKMSGQLIVVQSSRQKWPGISAPLSQRGHNANDRTAGPFTRRAIPVGLDHFRRIADVAT